MTDTVADGSDRKTQMEKLFSAVQSLQRAGQIVSLEGDDVRYGLFGQFTGNGDQLQYFDLTSGSTGSVNIEEVRVMTTDRAEAATGNSLNDEFAQEYAQGEFDRMTEQIMDKYVQYVEDNPGSTLYVESLPLHMGNMVNAKLSENTAKRERAIAQKEETRERTRVIRFLLSETKKQNQGRVVYVLSTEENGQGSDRAKPGKYCLFGAFEGEEADTGENSIAYVLDVDGSGILAVNIFNLQVATKTPRQYDADNVKKVSVTYGSDDQQWTERWTRLEDAFIAFTKKQSRSLQEERLLREFEDSLDDAYSSAAKERRAKEDAERKQKEKDEEAEKLRQIALAKEERKRKRQEQINEIENTHRGCLKIPIDALAGVMGISNGTNITQLALANLFVGTRVEGIMQLTRSHFVTNTLPENKKTLKQLESSVVPIDRSLYEIIEWPSEVTADDDDRQTTTPATAGEGQKATAVVHSSHFVLYKKKPIKLSELPLLLPLDAAPPTNGIRPCIRRVPSSTNTKNSNPASLSPVDQNEGLYIDEIILKR